jgi:hypothetical protein
MPSRTFSRPCWLAAFRSNAAPPTKTCSSRKMMVNDHLRLSYLKLRDKTILALVQFVLIEPLDGLPCFHAGYAVPEQYRGQGIAKAAFAGALAELLQGFGRAGVAEFYVEAVVGENNLASQRICEAVLGGPAESIKDSVSGKPALRYLKHLNKRG